MLLRRVVGQSMIPTLRPNTIVLAVKAKKPKVGQVVIALLDGRQVIKRIVNVKDQNYFLVGDNLSASTDSRTKGSVTLAQILGRVIWPRINS